MMRAAVKLAHAQGDGAVIIDVSKHCNVRLLQVLQNEISKRARESDEGQI